MEGPIKLLHIASRAGCLSFHKKPLALLDFKNNLINLALFPHVIFKYNKITIEKIFKCFSCRECSFLGVTCRFFQIKDEIEKLIKLLKHLKPEYVFEVNTTQSVILRFWTKIIAVNVFFISADLIGGSFEGGRFISWTREPIFWRELKEKFGRINAKEIAEGIKSRRLQCKSNSQNKILKYIVYNYM